MPTLVSIVIADATPTQATLTYDAALDTGSVPATNRYWTVDDGRPKYCSGVAVAGSVVTVTFDRSFIFAENVTFYYAVPATNPVRASGAGATVAAITGVTVTNNIVATGAIYSVDPQTGSDGNNGTSQATPWKTIPGTRTASNASFMQAAWGAITTGNKIPAGSRIRVKGGASFTSAICGRLQLDSNYYNSGTDKNPTMIIVADDWGTGDVTQNINGMSTVDASFSVNAVQSVSNIVVSGASATQRWRTINGASAAAWGAYGASSGSKLTGNGWRWVEISGHSNEGMEWTFQTQCWFREPLIFNIGTTAGAGILMGQLDDKGSDGARVKGGEIYNIGTSAGSSAIAHGIQSTAGSTVASPVIVDGVNIHNCGRDCIDMGLFRGNTGGQTHFLIMNCWLHNTGEDGIGCNNQGPALSGAVTMRAINNRIQANANGTQAYDGVLAYYIHNTFYVSGRTFFAYTEPTLIPAPPTTGVYTRNNLLVVGTSVPRMVDAYDGLPYFTWDSDANCWTNPGGALTDNDFLNAAGGAANYNNWAHFGANDIRTTTAQAFVNTATGDFHLATSNGVARAVAVDVSSTYPESAFDADHVERVYSTRAYAGAYEFPSAPPPPPPPPTPPVTVYDGINMIFP